MGLYLDAAQCPNIDSWNGLLPDYVFSVLILIPESAHLDGSVS